MWVGVIKKEKNIYKQKENGKQKIGGIMCFFNVSLSYVVADAFFRYHIQFTYAVSSALLLASCCCYCYETPAARLQPLTW